VITNVLDTLTGQLGKRFLLNAFSSRSSCSRWLIVHEHFSPFVANC
jgi:hypothetical protein